MLPLACSTADRQLYCFLLPTSNRAWHAYTGQPKHHTLGVCHLMLSVCTSSHLRAVNVHLPHQRLVVRVGGCGRGGGHMENHIHAWNNQGLGMEKGEGFDQPMPQSAMPVGLGKLARAALQSQVGLHSGCASPPLTSWRI